MTPRALIVRGDALYNLGNFETALINYHRAKKEAKIKEKQSILSRIHRTELAVSNAVGPTASHYYKHLEKFLFKIPEDIIGLPIFQLIKIKDANIESTKIKETTNLMFARQNCFENWQRIITIMSKSMLNDLMTIDKIHDEEVLSFVIYM